MFNKENMSDTPSLHGSMVLIYTHLLCPEDPWIPEQLSTRSQESNLQKRESCSLDFECQSMLHLQKEDYCQHTSEAYFPEMCLIR